MNHNLRWVLSRAFVARTKAIQNLKQDLCGSDWEHPFWHDYRCEQIALSIMADLFQ